MNLPLRLPARRRTDDGGAILVIAIVVVTVVALVTGFVLTRGEGSLRATVKLRNAAGTSYAADGAAQVALNGLRSGYWDGNAAKPAGWRFVNEVGDGCFGRNDNASILTPDGDVVLRDFYPASKSSGAGPTSAYVTCVPETATGAQGTVRHVTNANSPGDAIITLSNGGEDGLYNFNKVLKVRGGIRVNSNIDAKGQIEVQAADVRARTGCTGTVSVSAGHSRNCSAGGVSDPNYPADIATLPPLRTVPACGTGAYVELQPGYYDDAAALEALTTTCNKVIWFRSGTYYFDFHNSAANGDPLFESGVVGATDNEWRISTGRIIGGEIAGGGTPSAATPIPGACQNPIDSAAAQGVQFVFGGDSRILVDTKVELCATYRTNRPPIVLYGNKDGANPPLTALTGASGGLTTSGTPTVAGTGTDGTFTPLSAAALRDDGNGIATWQRTGGGVNGNETRTIAMGGFAPPATIPAGSVLKAARLVVRHKSAQNNAGTASTLRITPSVPGSTPLGPFNLTRPGTLTTETVDLKTQYAAVYNALAKSVHDKGYTGAGIDYTATVGRTQSAQLDAVRLELEYYVPQLRGTAAVPTNCTTTIGGSGCAVVRTDKKSELYLQGTTYLPRGLADIEVSNTEAQVFRWGVIARSLRVNVNGAYVYAGALIELPDNSPGMGLDGTLVQLTVHVCPGRSTCDASGQVALKVRAQVWDVDGDPATPDREVTVLSWSHQR